MGRAAQSWEVLSGLVVVILVCGWSDGQVLNKCDLRSRLQKAFLKHSSDNIAKMVCTVEYISHFNTSLVTANNRFLSEPIYSEGDHNPHQEVIEDYFPENWPEPIKPEDPSFLPEVESDGLIPARPTDRPAVTPVQDNNHPEGEGSGDELPSENGSGGSENHSKDKREVPSGEEPGEDVSGQDISEEVSGNGIKGPVDKPPLTDLPIYDGSFDPESGSGEPQEPITVIPQWDSTDMPNDYDHPTSGDQEIHYDTYESLFGHEPTEGTTDMPNDYDYLTTTIPPLGSNNEEVHYDTYESIFGHEPTEGTTDMPNDYDHPTSGDQEIPYDTYESLFGHEPTEGTTDMPNDYDYLTTTIPPLGSNNEEVHYDTYESIFGHEPTEGTTDMPNDYDHPTSGDQEIPYDTYESLYGHKPRKGSKYNPDNYEGRPFNNYDYDQDSSSRIQYGIFQLSDDVACKSQERNSLDICNLHCEDLTDDEITDDIACLMTLKQQGMDLMILEQCQTEKASEYFAECD